MFLKQQLPRQNHFETITTKPEYQTQQPPFMVTTQYPQITINKPSIQVPGQSSNEKANMADKIAEKNNMADKIAEKNNMADKIFDKNNMAYKIEEKNNMADKIAEKSNMAAVSGTEKNIRPSRVSTTSLPSYEE
jgi:hypothetical protein